MDQSPLDQACEILGSQTALAKALDIKSPSISEWRARKVPAGRCEEIERVTNGRIRCEDLRPDLEWVRLNGRPFSRPKEQPTDKPTERPTERSEGERTTDGLKVAA